MLSHQLTSTEDHRSVDKIFPGNAVRAVLAATSRSKRENLAVKWHPCKIYKQTRTFSWIVAQILVRKRPLNWPLNWVHYLSFKLKKHHSALNFNIFSFLISRQPSAGSALVQSNWFDRSWAIMYTQHMLNSCSQDYMSALYTTSNDSFKRLQAPGSSPLLYCVCHCYISPQVVPEMSTGIVIYSADDLEQRPQGLLFTCK